MNIFSRFTLASLLFSAVACSESGSQANTSQAAFPQPELISEWKSKIGESVTSLSIRQGYIYTAAGYDGALIFRLNSSNMLEKITNFIEDKRVRSVFLFETTNQALLFAACSVKEDTGVFQVFSLANPERPKFLFQSSNLAGNSPVAFASDGKYIYVADEIAGLVAYELSGTPEIPLEKLRIKLDGARVRAIAVDQRRKLAAVAAEEQGVYIVNLSSGKVLCRVQNPLSLANSVQIVSNFLVIGDRLSGIGFFDITKPDAPVNIGAYSTAGEAWDILLRGKQLTIADGGNGLIHLDINSIQSITNTWRYSVPGITYGVAIVSNTAYMACGADGIRLIKIP